MSLTLTTPTTALTEDEVFTIHGLSWDQYVAINDALGDQASLRLLFLDGSLTFVSPAYIHEWSDRALDAIVLAIAVGCDIEMEALGSTTLRKGANSAGIEGDEVYYLHENVALMGGSQGHRPHDSPAARPGHRGRKLEQGHQGDGDLRPTRRPRGLAARRPTRTP